MVVSRGKLPRSRHKWVSRRVWQPRLVFWAGAICIGLISVAFAYLADTAQSLFRTMTGGGGWRSYLPLLITPAGFAFCSFITIRYFPGSEGSGIPQAMAARVLRTDADRSRLLSLRMIFGKIALTLVGLFSGASIGREGPTVQVGAAIMLQAARWGGMAHARGLILAGSAAGIAAAFNTPLAGVVFAIEEMGRSYQARTNGLVLSAVILAGLAALGTVGNYTYFGVSDAYLRSSGDWILVVACGLGGGLMGGLFTRGALGCMRWLKVWTKPARMLRTVLFAALCGAVVGIIGVATGGQTFGTGYEQARAAIEGEALPLYFFLAKFVAGLVSTMSGIPGGIFAPSLSVGTGIGSTIGVVLGSDIGFAAVLGMAGYFSGVVQAPMTAFVIILEMTGNHQSVIPVMCSSMLGYWTARLVSPKPFYHAISELFVQGMTEKKRQRPAEDADASDVSRSQ